MTKIKPLKNLFKMATLLSIVLNCNLLMAQSEFEKEISEQQVISTISSSMQNFNLVGKTVMSSNLNKPCELIIKKDAPITLSMRTTDSKTAQQHQEHNFIFGDDAEGAKFLLKSSQSQVVIKQDFSDSVVKLTIEKPASTLRFVKIETIGAGEDSKTLVCVFDIK